MKTTREPTFVRVGVEGHAKEGRIAGAWQVVIRRSGSERYLGPVYRSEAIAKVRAANLVKAANAGLFKLVV